MPDKRDASADSRFLSIRSRNDAFSCILIKMSNNHHITTYEVCTLSIQSGKCSILA